MGWWEGDGEGSYCWSRAEGLGLQEEPAGSWVPLPICRVGVGEQELNRGGGDEVEMGEAKGNSGVPCREGEGDKSTDSRASLSGSKASSASSQLRDLGEATPPL